MIEDLKDEIKVLSQAERSSLHTVFVGIRDYLGRVNCLTKKYLNHMQVIRVEKEKELKRI